LPAIEPAPYWPRTHSARTRSGVNSRAARIALNFSSRTASDSRLTGGSIATSESTWKTWF
jgi:hypothetical protein